MLHVSSIVWNAFQTDAVRWYGAAKSGRSCQDRCTAVQHSLQSGKWADVCCSVAFFSLRFYICGVYAMHMLVDVCFGGDVAKRLYGHRQPTLQALHARQASMCAACTSDTPSSIDALLRCTEQAGARDGTSTHVASDSLLLYAMLQTQQEAAVPLLINCWPSASGSESYVNIEYESTVQFDLHNVAITIPIPGSSAPRINQVSHLCSPNCPWRRRQGCACMRAFMLRVDGRKCF